MKNVGDYMTKPIGIIYQRECGCCRQEFITNRQYQKYCSEKCRNKDWSKENRNLNIVYIKKCKYCDREFNTKYKNKLYCDSKCQINFLYPQKETRINKFIEKFNNRYGKFFTYIEGYPNKVITIKCNKCGNIKKRNKKGIFTSSNICCKKCNNNKKGIMKSICAECGNEYIKYSVQQILCKECHDKQEQSKKNVRKRLRENKIKTNGTVDCSITLTKLIKRDNHICKLCNKLVDESDYTYNNDVFIAGNYYPSIDHIIPLSKGGTHQWNNVQLAHRICNSIKCDKTPKKNTP